MIKQIAVVTRVENDVAYVKTVRESTCGQCGVQKGCGTSVFSKVLGNKFSELTALSTIKVEEGDVVMLGLRESVLISSALKMYLFPLLMMFAGALVMTFISELFDLALAQGWVILSSFTWLALAFGYIKHTSRQHEGDSKYQPVILSKATLSEIKASRFPIEVV